MASVYDVASFFIEYAGEESDVTNLKLQKLIYYAQGVHLARTGHTLFDEDILAWDYGPVVKEVYDKYKDNGANVIPACGIDLDDVLEEKEAETLIDVNREIGKYSAHYLVNKTHRNGTPWINTLRSKVIEINKIKEYFSEKEIVPEFDIKNYNLPEMGYINEEGYTVLPASEDDGINYDYLL